MRKSRLSSEFKPAVIALCSTYDHASFFKDPVWKYTLELLLYIVRIVVKRRLRKSKSDFKSMLFLQNNKAIKFVNFKKFLKFAKLGNR